MVIIADRSKDKFLFFFDSLVNIFKPTDDRLWAFLTYFGRDIDGIGAWTSSPMYLTPEQALKAAKIEALTAFVERARQLDWLSPLLLIPASHEALSKVSWEWIIAFFIGVELSAINHLLLDGLLVPLPLSVKKRLGGN